MIIQNGRIMGGAGNDKNSATYERPHSGVQHPPPHTLHLLFIQEFTLLPMLHLLLLRFP